jgi:hypothetical protein
MLVFSDPARKKESRPTPGFLQLHYVVHRAVGATARAYLPPQEFIDAVIDSTQI